MVLDPPGKKYIIGPDRKCDRIPDDAFPEKLNVDLDSAEEPPDGWVLRTVTMGYLESYEVWVNIRFAEADSYEELTKGYHGYIVDLDWTEEEGWHIEYTIDEWTEEAQDTSLSELDWSRTEEGIDDFETALASAFQEMDSLV